MAALTIQFGEKLAAASQLWRLGQVGVMACAAGSLNEARWQNGLFPGQRRFVSFGNFRGWALAAMANRAAPVANVVRNRRMRAERLGDGSVAQARLRDSLVASSAAIHHIHSRKPDLIDARAVVRHQFFCVRTSLRKPQVGALVLLPLAAKILEW